MQDNLSELISSRICHDLISPVGAIGNGLELMNELGGATPELALVEQSAQSAQAKLKFFRVAFGAGGSAQIGGPEARRVAEEMFSSGRITIAFSRDWGARERRLVKLFYLLLLCVESSLPRGGEINCAPTDSGWLIEVGNTPVAAPAVLWQHITQGQNGMDISAKTIQFSLARQCMVAQSIAVSLEHSSSAFRLAF